jgi:hypothetical protein
MKSRTLQQQACHPPSCFIIPTTNINVRKNITSRDKHRRITTTHKVTKVMTQTAKSCYIPHTASMGLNSNIDNPECKNENEPDHKDDHNQSSCDKSEAKEFFHTIIKTKTIQPQHQIIDDQSLLPPLTAMTVFH